MSKLFRVFYSWQSDLSVDCHQRLIRDALHDAVAESPKVLLTIDEATRDEAGAPDIPSTILKKISDADAFVADLTTIGTVGKRACQNPNVLAELGMAVALLGWSRIILVGNNAVTPFPDGLPFDIEKRRAFPFKAANETAVKSAQGQLRATLVAQIKTIATKDPSRPVLLALDEATIRKERDVRLLKTILLYANSDVIADLVLAAPERMSMDSFWFWETFHASMRRPSALFSDKLLSKKVAAVHKAWLTLCTNDRYYIAVRKHYVWRREDEIEPTLREKRDWKRAVDACNELDRANRDLCKFVARKYHQIDTHELLKESFRAWRADLVETSSVAKSGTPTKMRKARSTKP